jgi:hypothetical protein
VELVDHQADGAGANLNSGEPQRNAGERPEHEAQQHQPAKVPVDKLPRQRVAGPHRDRLEVAQEQPAADGELGEKHVRDRHAADDHPFHQRPEVVDRIIGKVHRVAVPLRCVYQRAAAHACGAMRVLKHDAVEIGRQGARVERRNVK